MSRCGAGRRWGAVFIERYMGSIRLELWLQLLLRYLTRNAKTSCTGMLVAREVVTHLMASHHEVGNRAAVARKENRIPHHLHRWLPYLAHQALFREAFCEKYAPCRRPLCQMHGARGLCPHQRQACSRELVCPRQWSHSQRFERRELAQCGESNSRWLLFGRGFRPTSQPGSSGQRRSRLA